jgi:hypothetical protein
MSLLANAAPAKRGPLICTFVGAAGTGKTSLATTFPKPFMIQTTGEGVPDDASARPDQLGITDSSEKLRAQFEALLKEEHDYKTLIMDSVSGLESMFIQELLASDPKARGINQALGGYGAGAAAVAASHMRVRKTVEALRQRRGMHVVFIAHADISRIDPPDTEGYNQYTLRLGKHSLKSYVDDVDLVGHLKQGTVLIGEEGNKKARSTDEVVLIAHLTPAYVTKNRLGITEEIEVKKGENPLAKYLEANG